MEMLSYLKSVGLPVNPLSKKIRNANEMIAYHKTLEDHRLSINYEIDGSVIKVNDYKLRDRLGLRARSPRWAIAAKFKAKKTESQILSIDLQVGRTGVITPVAKIKEVDLSGVMISSATLHNQDEIDRKDIRINDFILIERSGDVIPKISKVLKDKRPNNAKKFSISDFNCPESGCKIERIKDQAAYRCLNIDCKSRVLGMLEHFCSKNAMNIEGMGPQIVRQLLEANLLNRFDDIYKLKYNDLVTLERFKDKSAMNLINSINQSKKTTFPRFVFGLGIPNVGQHISKVIDKYCNSSLQKLGKLQMKEMEEIDGIGSTVAIAIENYFNVDKNIEIINSCIKLGVELTPTHFDQSNMKMLSEKIVITGSLESLSRNDLKQRLERNGATVTSAISSKTTTLIVGNNPGSKLKKAQNLNIKIVHEKELHDFLDQN
jgi:DNA ligase (NAD+)